MRAKRFAAMLMGISILSIGIGCATGRVTSFPAPEYPCPTPSDATTLAVLLPDPASLTPNELVMIRGLAGRYIYAGAYCRAAEEVLQ